MPFRRHFERRVNENMQDDGQPGRAPPEEDIKKMPPSPSHFELEDQEFHEKKDHPPRFSTLFGATPPPPPPPPPPEPPRIYQQEYFPRPERRRGVYIPTPLFIVFAIILFFESTILFAYTVIGLYNNAPSRLMPWAGPGVATACDCGEKQAAVNFAPNFIMGGQPGESPVVAALPEPNSISTTSSSTSTSSSTTSSSTSSTTTSTSIDTSAAAAASDIAGILGGLTTSSESSLPPITYTSIKLVTSIALPTVTSTLWVPNPTPTVTATNDSTSEASQTTASDGLSTTSSIPPPPSTTEESSTAVDTPTASPTPTKAHKGCTQQYSGYNFVGNVCPS